MSAVEVPEPGTSLCFFLASAVTFVNYHRCSPLEEKHRLDGHHCITPQPSPSPTNADALLEEKP